MNNPRQLADRAEQLFAEGYNCCESTVTALVESLGMRCDCLPGLATGLGGGVGHTGDVCGAVTGGAMAVGLAAVRKGLASHVAEKDWANAIVTELVEAFDREFNYHRCRELIGIDFRATDWLEQYRDGGCKEKCSSFVRFVTHWVAERLTGEGF